MFIEGRILFVPYGILNSVLTMVKSYKQSKTFGNDDSFCDASQYILTKDNYCILIETPMIVISS